LKAYRVHAGGKFGAGRFDTMSHEELDKGNVVVRIAYASVNYKDALTARGKAKIALRFPLVAGIDLAGTVEASEDPRFRKGDAVIVHSFGLGGEHDGGYAEFGRFPADWVIPLPKGLSLFEAKGKVLVNGATGGVASIAIDLLSQLGFHVVAMTGKSDQHDYLRSLGAKEFLERKTSEGERPLETAEYAGAVDSVGGEQLAWLARRMHRDGVIAAFGNAGGAACGCSAST
jgi:acrylyl-CoA reductase (NADPH)